MPRKKRLSPEAEAVTIYLTPEEQLVMQIIRSRRKTRQEVRTSPSEIASDGLWKILGAEGITREQIQTLLPPVTNAAESNVKIFQRPDKK